MNKRTVFQAITVGSWGQEGWQDTAGDRVQVSLEADPCTRVDRLTNSPRWDLETIWERDSVFSFLPFGLLLITSCTHSFNQSFWPFRPQIHVTTNNVPLGRAL